MSQKVRIALTLDLDNPVHKKAYTLLSKLNRAHSEFIAYITSNFIDRNYSGDVSKISKSDAKILALCAKCCCNDDIFDFTADPKILGQLVMLLNQNAIKSGSDVDTVIRNALANINVFARQTEHAAIPDRGNTSLPNTQFHSASNIHEVSPESHDLDDMHEQKPDSNNNDLDLRDSCISENETIDMDSDTDNDEDIDSDDMPIEINEAALQAFNSML